MEDLRREIRGWLISERVGLISRTELVRRVDELIAELGAPPDYLISLSLGQSVRQEPLLDLVTKPVTGDDCPRVAEEILRRYEAGEIDLDDVGLYSLKMAEVLGAEQAFFLDFDWINDEVYLVGEGIKDRSESKGTIIEVLRRIAASFSGS